MYRGELTKLSKNMNRSETISMIANAIIELPKGQPLRVAVNGRIASGKTTLATELATELRQNGYLAQHIGVDGFHNPRAIRYRQGRASARGYYEDAYDLDALRRLLLEPLGKPASTTEEVWFVRTASFDLETDTPFEAPLEPMSAEEILIVDGSFLLVPKLRSMWDYSVFIDVDREIGVERGASRDADYLNGIEEARRLHHERYQAACDLYLQENEPWEIADVIVENANFDEPSVSFKSN